MNDPFIITNEINKELKEIEHLGFSLSERLSQLSRKIRYIFSKIQSCETFESAGYYFNILAKIHHTLACLVFKEEIWIDDRLIKFINEFDHLGQINEYYYEKIKNDEYKF